MKRCFHQIFGSHIHIIFIDLLLKLFYCYLGVNLLLCWLYKPTLSQARMWKDKESQKDWSGFHRVSGKSAAQVRRVQATSIWKHQCPQGLCLAHTLTLWEWFKNTLDKNNILHITKWGKKVFAPECSIKIMNEEDTPVLKSEGPYCHTKK